MHFIYLLTITLYINDNYTKPPHHGDSDAEEEEHHEGKFNDKFVYLALLSVGIIYPLIYDNYQLYKTGFVEYFS